MRLHHVQVACPRGGEDAARRFYGDGLGLTEVAKPEALAGRGGVWFRSYDAEGGTVAELHVGVEEPFAPARKAHPALRRGSYEPLLAREGVHVHLRHQEGDSVIVALNVGTATQTVRVPVPAALAPGTILHQAWSREGIRVEEDHHVKIRLDPRSSCILLANPR